MILLRNANVFKFFSNSIISKSRSICTTNKLSLFWEKDPKGGYDTSNTKNISRTELIRHGLKELKSEIKLWREELQEKFEEDPILVFRPGETDIVWQFGNKSSLEKWVVTSDKDHGQGKSECQLTLNPQGKGLFSGALNKEPPKDGRTKKAGYCNMKTLQARKSFKRDSYLDWRQYNKLVLRVRGDGRPYLLNISTAGYFDVMWNDVYHYILYTRGGPYWQVAKIPFSKFFLSSKGRVQDKQSPIALDKVRAFGISAGDKVNGQFNLEIDYIGLEFDPSHTEEFAYEMYKIKQKYIIAT